MKSVLSSPIVWQDKQHIWFIDNPSSGILQLTIDLINDLIN